MRPTSNITIKKIEEFKSSGFARTSTLLMNYMRKNNEPYIKVFRPGAFVRAGKGSIRYSSRDIFGYSHFSHIYDIRHTKQFVDYLVKVFLTKNPEADGNIRKAFTRILHNNGLHWEGCYHYDKKREYNNWRINEN